MKIDITKTLIPMIELIMVVVSAYLIISESSWMLFLGIFLFVYGNNIIVLRILVKEINEGLKWKG